MSQTTPTPSPTPGGSPAVDVLEEIVQLIQSTFPTVESRLVGTLVTVALLVLVGLVVERAGPFVKERYGDAIVETVQAGLMSALTALVAGFLVVVWGADRQVAVVLGAFDISARQVVTAVLSVAVLAGAYSLTRVTKRAIRRVSERRGAVSQHQREVIHHIVQLCVYAFSLFVVLALWNVDVSGLLVGAGFLGIVLGLAARQTLGSVIAGIVVLFSRPFELGDWIRVDDQEGVVTDITVVNTRLRTFDDEVVIIPNDVVTSTDVVNRSRRGRLRLNVDVGVDYEVDVDRAIEVAEDAMAEVDLLLDRPEPHVVLTEFGPSSVVLRLRFHIDDPSARKMWRTRTRVMSAVADHFAEEDVTIPFPQRELSGRGDGFRLADGIDDAAEPQEDAVEGED